MTIATSPDPQSDRIAKALTSVEAAPNGRAVFDQLEAGHPSRTSENDQVTSEFLQATIRSAMTYGYPVEAVAVAAHMTVDDVMAIIGDSAA